MIREEKIGNINNTNRRKTRVFSFFVVFILLLTSFTVLIIVMPGSIAPASPPSPSSADIKGTTWSEDNYMRQRYVTATAYRTYNYGGLTYIWIDAYATLISRNRGLIRFDIKGYFDSLGKTVYIYTAQLKLYMYGGTGSYTNKPVNLYRIDPDRNWDEGTASGTANVDSSWKYYDYSSQWSTMGCDHTTYDRESAYVQTNTPSSSYNWMTWSGSRLDQDVRDFYNTPSQNQGWMFKYNDESGGERIAKFRSSEYGTSTYRPTLTVTYCELPECQTNDIQAGGVGETSATLRGQVTDDGGDYCNYQFSYNRKFFMPSTTSWSAGTVSGSGPFFQSASSLSRGRRYYYQAKLKNDAGDGSLGLPEKSFLTAPGQITGFTATPFGIGQINLTWNNGAASTGIDGAYIENATGESAPGTWNRGDYTSLGYCSGTAKNLESLDINTTYYFKAWPSAYDDEYSSDGTDTKPYGTATSIINGQTEDFPDEWYLIDGDNLYSCCGGETTLKQALNGTDLWSHLEDETHQFIIDLGTNYTVGKVRGRSWGAKDPTMVNIYVSRNTTNWGTAVASNIETWQDTGTSWVVVDATDKDGRYIKAEITATEDGDNHIQWGYLADPFTIFDAYVSNCLPEMSCDVNNSTPDAGSTIQFDASESFDQGGSIVNYTWDFDGDGQTDSETETAVVDHEYNFSSVYTAIITAEDDFGSTNSTTQQVTVKQKITIVNNSENNGVNYMVWGATASIEASELADVSYADLQNNDTIQMFNISSGDWDTTYVKGGAGGFTINRWDHIRIQCTNTRSFSVTPDGSVDSSQNKTLTFTDNNHGYHYYTWSNDFSIKASDFATNPKLDLTNQPISIYIHTTGEWKGYTEIPGLPQPVKDGMDFYINLYDVICFKVASGTENAYYDADNYQPT